MRKRNIEILFNNGAVRQILLLPEAPLKITFFFEEKELTLNEKYCGEGFYFISDQKGFPGTNIRPYESEVVQTPLDLSSLGHIKGYKQSSEVSDTTLDANVFRGSSCDSVKKEAGQASVNGENSQVTHQIELITQEDQPRIQPDNSKITEDINHLEKYNTDEDDSMVVDMPTYFSSESHDDTGDTKDFQRKIVLPFNRLEPNKACDNQNDIKQANKSSQCNRKVRGCHKRCEICLHHYSYIQNRTYFKYPKDPKLCQKWVAACPRPFLLRKTLDQLAKSHYVCSMHFRKQDISGGFNKKYRRLIGSACPSVCLPALPQSGCETGSTLKGILNLSRLRDNLRNKFKMVAEGV